MCCNSHLALRFFSLCVKKEALFRLLNIFEGRDIFGYTITMELLHVMGSIVLSSLAQEKCIFLSMHNFFREARGIIFQRVPLRLFIRSH